MQCERMTGSTAQPGPVMLRPFRDTDANALPAIYREAVRIAGARDYGPGQVEAWAGLVPDAEAYRRRACDGRVVWVASLDDRPVAYADLESNGHLDHLYCSPAASGCGIGAALALTLEAVARNRGMTDLHVEASETARPTLERLGWKVSRRRELSVGGVPIHNHAMTRAIPPAAPSCAPTARTQAFFETFQAATGASGRHQVAAFGDTEAMQDELAALALDGTKRATAALLGEFASGEPFPFVGGHTVLMDGGSTPRAVWRTTEVRLGRLDSIDESFAWDEGEGERTRDDWLAGHRRYFNRMAEREGFDMHDGISTVFERFEIVWPVEPSR